MSESALDRPLPGRAWRLSWPWAALWLLLAVPAVYAALANNIGALAYDAATAHIYRAVAFSQAISDGVLYPRWTQFLHLGLGSPIFTFVGPLPYYGLDLLYRLGFAHPLGWRILMASGLLAAGLGTYLLVKCLSGRRWPALLAAAAYLYAPYILRNALERGSNEAFSVFLYPWVLWALVALARRPGPLRFAVASVVWALCIGCHVLAPLLLLPVAGLAALALAWRYRTVTPPLAVLAGGLLMAFVWLPMIAEQSWVHIGRDFEQAAYTQPAHNPIPLDRLLALPAIYDVGRDNNGTGDAVGLPQFALVVLGLPAAWAAWRRGRRALAVYLGAATAAGLFLFWLLTPSADALWIWLQPLLNPLQFRSRWMGLQALMAACAAGLSLAILPARWQRTAGLALAGLLLVAALPALYVNLQHRYAPFDQTLSLAEVRRAELQAGGTGFTSFSEFTPAARRLPVSDVVEHEAGPDFDPQTQPLVPVAALQVLQANVRTSSWDLDLRAAAAVTATLHVLYYPRWQAYLDGQRVPAAAQPETGYLQVALPPGAHRLALRYGSTPVETGGIAISGLVAAGLLATLAAAAWLRGRDRRPAWPAPVAPPGLLPGPRLGEERPVPLWLLGGLLALVTFKLAYVDGHTTWFRCVSTETQVCDAQAAANVPFAGGPTLRGYTVSAAPLDPGAELRLSLVWQAGPVSVPGLRSFVHIRNSTKDQPLDAASGSDIWAQDNHVTPGGLPAAAYRAGKLYLDEYRLRLPAAMPPGIYYLEIGWYDPAADQQLDPQSAAVVPPLQVLWRSVLLPSITVSGPEPGAG